MGGGPSRRRRHRGTDLAVPPLATGWSVWSTRIPPAGRPDSGPPSATAGSRTGSSTTWQPSAPPSGGIDRRLVAAATRRRRSGGSDQADAVEQLCSAGPALRALISPAGYGKTTTLAAATDAARRAGRPVLALSTTNQAVDQLRQVGIPAMTVARFARAGAKLEPGSVVVVDEFSQLPTREAHTVLAAAAGCAGAHGVDGRRPPPGPTRRRRRAGPLGRRAGPRTGSCRWRS